MLTTSGGAVKASRTTAPPAIVDGYLTSTTLLLHLCFWTPFHIRTALGDFVESVMNTGRKVGPNPDSHVRNMAKQMVGNMACSIQ